jgi:hypothetical protein
MSKEQELRVAIQIYLYWMNTAKEKRGIRGEKKTVPEAAKEEQ